MSTVYTEKPTASPMPKEKTKYTDEQKTAAEENVVATNAKAVTERTKFIEETVEKLSKALENEDFTTRSTVMEELSARILSIKTVATASKLRPSRFAVLQEEKASMPRLTPSTAPGDDVRRNIMQQGEQNRTSTLTSQGAK